MSAPRLPDRPTSADQPERFQLVVVLAHGSIDSGRYGGGPRIRMTPKPNDRTPPVPDAERARNHSDETRDSRPHGRSVPQRRRRSKCPLPRPGDRKRGGKSVRARLCRKPRREVQSGATHPVTRDQTAPSSSLLAADGIIPPCKRQPTRNPEAAARQMNDRLSDCRWPYFQCNC